MKRATIFRYGIKAYAFSRLNHFDVDKRMKATERFRLLMTQQPAGLNSM